MTPPIITLLLILAFLAGVATGYRIAFVANLMTRSSHGPDR